MNKLTDLEKKRIVGILGIDNLTTEEVDKILLKLEDIILTRLAKVINDKLTDEERNKIESGKYSEAITNRIENFNDIVNKISKETVEEFQNKMKTKKL